MKFERMMGTLRRETKSMLKWAEEKGNEQIRNKDVVKWGIEETIDDAADINEQIHDFLMMYTEGSPQVKIKMCNENGLEA